MSFNLKNAAVKRLMREAKEMSDPTEQFYATPVNDNLFEWHFTFRGLMDSDYDGGIYHGRINFPTEYPMKPPSFMFSTDNGRFETNTKICLSISVHHPESWQPSWSTRTAILAIMGFMNTESPGAIGALNFSSKMRISLAKKSINYKCKVCGSVCSLLLPIKNKKLYASMKNETQEAAAKMAITTELAEEKLDKNVSDQPSTSDSKSYVELNSVNDNMNTLKERSKNIYERQKAYYNKEKHQPEIQKKIIQPSIETNTTNPNPPIIGSKSDNWNMIVKSEFGDRILGESPKIEVHKSEPCHINFNSYLHFQPTSKEIDEICNFPIILNFIEILPKEKKQKDEKTVLMYQCVVDLINLINSCETEHFMTLQVHRVDNVTNDITKIVDIVSTAKVKISVRESIFSEKLLESKVCIASLTLESLFSPPDAWVNSTGNFYYVGAFPFIFNDKENLLIFNEGHLEPPLTSRNKSLQLKRWNCRNGKIMGNAVYMNNSFLSFEDEKSQVGQNDKSFIKFREEVEVEKSHVTWNNEQRKYMDEECTKTLSDNIAKYRLFPLEIFRVSAAAPGKSKKDDEINVSYHGVAYIDMTPLLYPGVTYLRGYFRVCGFNEQEYTKTTQQKTILENATKIVSSLSHKNGNSPFPKSKKDKDKQSVKDVKSTNKADITDDGSGYNTEGQIFNENKTYVSIDITLSRPLVKKRTIEAINKTISEIIPDRPAYPFEILDEYSLLVNEESLIDGDETYDNIEERRENIIYKLNSSGKHYAFREQLKYTIVNVIRHTFGQTTNIENEDELHKFVAELHVYLVDKMHKALNEMLSIEESIPIPEPITTSEQMKNFACEAEHQKKCELALSYHQDRLDRDTKDPDVWFDFGIFHYSRKEHIKVTFLSFLFIKNKKRKKN
ncbi:hypothetical protein A3Q56_06594 [Intoshia linei]|uniref:UBC core domain-containing protein n=1 Tax=Intoshia linei TaxID=1819745 RepID=A0A177AW79_9BILA|nr:hypothetical protein A3Q56_06594 [Intoshia linei]